MQEDPQQKGFPKFHEPIARAMLKFLEERVQFRCTAMLRNSKLVKLDDKSLACFT